MAQDDDNAGQIGLCDAANPFNKHSFQFRQMLGRASITKLVKIVKITPGKDGQAGTVDVQLITKQMDGEGKTTPHGTVYALPYVRHQNGQHAIIMDPVVGDIGPIHCMDRDISSNIQARGEAAPGSNRRFDTSDGVYFGGILNAAATTYFQQSGGDQTHVAAYVKANKSGGNQSYTATGGNISHTSVYSSDNNSSNGNLSHTATGGNISASATKQSSNGGNISHSADVNITHTAGVQHIINAVTHNINATTNISKVTSILQTLKLGSSISQITNYISHT